jgi:hypothetical protein
MNARRIATVIVCSLFLTEAGFAQQAAAVSAAASRPQASRHKLDLATTYHRLICIVPMVGAGSRTDPWRPAYVPLPDPAGKPWPRTGIIGFAHLPSDDKKFAIVEFVAATPTAFKAILADKSVIAFNKGSTKRADIEKTVQTYRKGFSVDHLRVMVP